MIPNINAGTGIFLEKPSRYSISHLWLVITEPRGNPSEVIIVNLTSYREGVDTTLVLTDKDYSYIIHPTIVYYADARKIEVQLLQRLLALDNDRLYKDSCSNELLDRIRNGLLESDFTPRKIKKYLREQL